MRILFTDTETGGLDPRKHSLLQVGIVAYEVGKGILGADELYVARDKYDVTEGAMKVNKLDLEVVNASGYSPSLVAQFICDFIEGSFGEIKSKNDRPILSGHNVGFDKGFIETQLFDASGRDMQKYISHRTLDIMGLLWGLHIAGKIPLEACTSKGAFDYFGIENENAHTALSDIMASIKVYEAAIELMKG